MTDELPNDPQPDEATDATSVEQNAVNPSYKVLGEFDDAYGAGILGQNDATDGTPIGVQGAVPNASSGWGLYTDDDARVAGTVSADTVAATRVEADTVVTADAGTTVWDAWGQSIPDGTRTKIEFQNVERDQRNQWDTTNYAITVTEPGNYLVSAGLYWADWPSSGTNNWITVRRNDSIGVLQDFSDGFSQLQASRPVLGVDANDTFHLDVEQYEGSALDVGGSRISTYLSVVQL